DAEHQENDSHFSKLFGELLISREPGRVRPDEHSGKEVADQRRQPETMREIASRERSSQTARERDDEVEGVHAPSYAAGNSRRLAAGSAAWCRLLASWIPLSLFTACCLLPAACCRLPTE